MDATTDSLALVRQAQAGDRQALDALIHRFYARVRRAVRARIGPALRSRIDSGDILQQTFLQAVQRLPTFIVSSDSEGSLTHWFSKIAEAQIRDAADYHSAQKRCAEREQPLDSRPADGSQPLADALADQSPTPLQELARGERQRLFEECLDGLPRHYREVLVLREYEHVQWHEVARMMSRAESTVRCLHQQALGELRLMLRRRGVDAIEA